MKKPRPPATKLRTKEDFLAEVFDRIAVGESMLKICQDPGMPARKSIFKWIDEDEEVKRQYNEALRLRGEHYADGVMESAEAAVGLDAPGVNAQRLIVDTKKWIAARLLPRKYGDRVVLAGDTDNPLQVQHLPASEELLAKIKGVKK